MKILVKFPTRERRRKFERVFRLYLNSYSKDVTFLVSYDVDDPTMNGVENNNWGNHHIVWSRGKSNGKIHACNRDVEKVTDWDVIILASDDMTPKINKWDELIRFNMKKHYPDTDGVLHFNDGHTGKRLNTMCIMGKKYYERTGSIYNPEYKSFFCDDEFTQVSYALGKATYFDTILFKHDHPANIGVGNDALYQKNNRFWSYDQSVFNRRKRINFGL